jgi:hypothetical protein
MGWPERNADWCASENPPGEKEGYKDWCNQNEELNYLHEKLREPIARHA